MKTMTSRRTLLRFALRRASVLKSIDRLRFWPVRSRPNGTERGAGLRFRSLSRRGLQMKAKAKIAFIHDELGHVPAGHEIELSHTQAASVRHLIEVYETKVVEQKPETKAKK